MDTSFWAHGAVWSAIAAFLGFTLGTGIKHRFDLRRDDKISDEKRKAVAAILSAEMENIVRACSDVVRWIDFYSGAIVAQDADQQRAPALPPLKIFESLIDEIGYLPFQFTMKISKVYTRYFALGRTVEWATAMPRQDRDAAMKQLRKESVGLRREAAPLGTALLFFANNADWLAELTKSDKKPAEPRHDS